VETRLGRKLNAADFADVPLNDPERNRMSARLLDRLKAPPPRPRWRSRIAVSEVETDIGRRR
jgi:hypothetical protein